MKHKKEIESKINAHNFLEEEFYELVRLKMKLLEDVDSLQKRVRLEIEKLSIGIKQNLWNFICRRCKRSAYVKVRDIDSVWDFN